MHKFAIKDAKREIPKNILTPSCFHDCGSEPNELVDQYTGCRYGYIYEVMILTNCCYRYIDDVLSL